MMDIRRYCNNCGTGWWEETDGDDGTRRWHITCRTDHSIETVYACSPECMLQLAHQGFEKCDEEGETPRRYSKARWTSDADAEAS